MLPTVDAMCFKPEAKDSGCSKVLHGKASPSNPRKAGKCFTRVSETECRSISTLKTLPHFGQEGQVPAESLRILGGHLHDWGARA